MTYQYIDVHCHPNLHGLRDDQDEVIERMRENRVLGIVVGVDFESSREAAALAEKHEYLWATVGVHPNNTHAENFDASKFSAFLENPKVVGIGECGLDYFRPEGDLEAAKKKQFEELEKQIAFAEEHNKPLMVHCRPSKNSMDAYRDFADFIEPYAKRGMRGNMHFFVGNLEVAKRFWDLGFTTSFTGVITFTNEYDEVVREAPKEMILTETDAPYAAPAPHRGKRNEPHYVQFVTEKIAELRGESVEDIQKTVLENARNLFGVTSKSGNEPVVA